MGINVIDMVISLIPMLLTAVLSAVIFYCRPYARLPQDERTYLVATPASILFLFDAYYIAKWSAPAVRESLINNLHGESFKIAAIATAVVSVLGLMGCFAAAAYAGKLVGDFAARTARAKHCDRCHGTARNCRHCKYAGDIIHKQYQCPHGVYFQECVLGRMGKDGSIKVVFSGVSVLHPTNGTSLCELTPNGQACPIQREATTKNNQTALQ